MKHLRIRNLATALGVVFVIVIALIAWVRSA